MKLLDLAGFRLRQCGLLLFFLAPGSLVAGCVSLSKPQRVVDCEKSTRGCIDNSPPLGPDAAQDVAGQPGPDLAPGDGPATVGRDAPSDSSPTAPDTADAGASNNDLASDNRPASDPVAGAETPPKTDGAKDVPAEATPGAEPGPEPPGAEPAGSEPGPEPGAEPSAGAEPGPEPAARPEPGPEPGKEPGPEPGPEPPRDAGSTSACANATSIGGSNGTVTFQTTGAFCFVTCNAIGSWGCSSFGDADRTIKVNSTSVKCSAALPAQKSGYFYFEVSAGAAAGDAGHTWDAIWFSGTAATSCTPPAGGFTP